MIKITGLLENTTAADNVKCKHGLSVYIETDKHKILFDVGPNELFLKNAKTLGVGISSVDIAVISHGHVDHCGGLKCFLENNEKAGIYLRKDALEKHFVKVLGIPFFAGIDNNLVKGDRFVFTDDVQKIDDEITLFSNVSGDFPLPKSDGNLFVKRGGKIVSDDFRHEQNLLINADGKTVLVCGCAHAGIVNIIDRSKAVSGGYPDVVIGGFHLFEPTSKRYESKEYIESVATALDERNAKYFTCHCTGTKAAAAMQNVLHDKLSYLHTGSVFTL